MTIEDDLHQLVDALDDGAARGPHVPPGVRAPRFLRDTLLDDEPGTQEERAVVTEAWVAIARGDVVHAEDLEHELAW